MWIETRLLERIALHRVVARACGLKHVIGALAEQSALPESLANLEQVRVCCRADQVQVVVVDFVEQEPIRFDVAVPMMFPVAAKRGHYTKSPKSYAKASLRKPVASS